MFKKFYRKDFIKWLKLYLIGLPICCMIELIVFAATNGDYNHDITRYVVMTVVIILMVYYFKSDFTITRKKRNNEFISSLNTTVRVKRVKK